MHRHVRLACLLTALVILFTGKAQGEDWPTHLYDNSRAGATSEKLTLPLKSAWSYSAPSKIRLAWSGPEGRTFEGLKVGNRVSYDAALEVAIVKDRLYFGSSIDHQVYCVDLTNGKTLWSFFTGGPVRLAPTVDDGRVYVGSDDGNVYCLDADNGGLVWKRRAGPSEEWILARGEMVSRWPVRTGILIDNGIAYFGAGIFPYENVYLYALDAKTGRILWKRDNVSQEQARRNDLSPQGYLSISDKYLFIPSGRSAPATFHREDGRLKHKKTYSWRREGLLGGTRVIAADKQLYIAGPHQMVATAQETGNVGFGWFEAKHLVIQGKDAFAITGTEVRRMNRQAYAEASGKRQSFNNLAYNLRRQLRGKPKNEAKIRADLMKAVADAKKLEKVGITWATKIDSVGALTATGNLVVVGGKDRVDVFDAESGKSVWNAKVDGEVRALAAANGHLVASTTTGKIYVFADDKQPKVEPASEKLTKNPYPKDPLTKIYADAAKQILATSKIKKGFCLVAGAEKGRLAHEIAKQSDLKVYCVEPSKKKVDEARRALSSAGVYGHRITVHQADLGDVPYSSYFANLIVSDHVLLNGKLIGDATKIVRHLKPIGGKIVLGGPEGTAGAKLNRDKASQWLNDADVDKTAKIDVAGRWAQLTRGSLPGAGSWTHQYGEPGNTASSADTRVKGGLGVLWYGDPGPGQMVNRHDGAVGPLAVNGRLIVQGEFSVMGYDAYNGMFLWKYENPKTFRTGVFQNNNAGNLAASADRVFIMEGEKVIELGAATGEKKAEHLLPEGKRKDRVWTYLAIKGGKLYGTSSVRKELIAAARRRGRKYEDQTDALFAIDLKTGKHLWSYVGKTIAAPTIAIGDNRIYFIDSTIGSDQREELLKQDKSELAKLKGEERKIAEQRMKRLDARLAVALNSDDGKEIWKKPTDVTDCSEIGIGGGKLTMIYKEGMLLLGGANANGHYWKQFIAGEFKRRRLVVLSATSGNKMWAKDANYRHRPIIVGERVIAEPWAFDLRTGKQEMRRHPITGKEVPWSMMRADHHCGMLVGSPNMLMFRSGFTGFYDLYEDNGTKHFAGHRLGCWINAIPANGLVMIPEASAGCVCLFSIASTIVMEPRESRRPWTMYSVVGKQTPVEHLHLNLGAPGDRKDETGRIWIAYPRPRPSRETSLDLKLDLQEKKSAGGKFDSVNALATTVKGGDPQWIYTSWSEGVTRITIQALGKGDAPATYRIRLHFAEMDEKVKPGERIFDVKLQGKTVLSNVDVVKLAGSDHKALMREIAGVKVADNVVVELAAKTKKTPILNAIEVIRAGGE